jgi:hypothetical protein
MDKCARQRPILKVPLLTSTKTDSINFFLVELRASPDSNLLAAKAEEESLT